MKSILFTVVIIVLLSTTAMAQPTNDSWHDKNWGGDTGEEFYKEPPPEANNTDDDDGGGICASTFSFLVLIPIAIIMKYKEIREKKEEETCEQS